MKKLSFLLMLGIAFAANAQGFTDEPTCYSWEGGHKSAGSFTKCPGPWVVAKKPAPAPVAAPVVAAPILQSTVCPPQVVLQPEPTKRKAKPKPRPLPTCR